MSSKSDVNTGLVEDRESSLLGERGAGETLLGGPLDGCAEIWAQDDADLGFCQVLGNGPGLGGTKKSDLELSALLLELLLELDQTDDLVTVVNFDDEGQFAADDEGELFVCGKREGEGLLESSAEVCNLGGDGGEES